MFWASWIEIYFTRMGNEDYAGISILVMGIFYLSTCVALPYTCEHAPRRFTFVLSFIGFGFCCMFMGPSHILGMYGSDWSLLCVPEEVGGLECSELDNPKTEGYLFSPRIYVVASALALMGFF
jgi:hypothetical protein